jgi:hypothetical protein
VNKHIITQVGEDDQYPLTPFEAREGGGSIQGVTYVERLLDHDEIKGMKTFVPARYTPEPGKLCWSPKTVTIASDPRVVSLGPGAIERLMQWKVEDNFRFTCSLEGLLIAPTSLAVSLEDHPARLPDALRRDVYRSGGDEVFHGYFTSLLLDDFAKAHGRSPARRSQPAILRVVEEARLALADPRLSSLARVMATNVSETLITSSLSTVHRDATVADAIRVTLAEHSREEAMHHAIWAPVSGILWGQLGPEDRARLGPFWADFIAAFLDYGDADAGAWLQAVGMDERTAREVVADSAAAERAQRRRAAAPTINHLRRNGLLDTSAVVDGLGRHDLIN